MLEGKRIAVVVPAYREETQISMVIETMPEFVDRVIVVDDCSPDRTAEIASEFAAADPRVEVIRLDRNSGVGAAIVAGYRRSIEACDDVAAVMAGDGQMPPDELADICLPVVRGECDYAKANRLASGEAWSLIPRKRYLGNAALTFLTKVASGYYQITDSQTGFTAISREMLEWLDLDAMYPRYGYPNDMLVRLNVLRARVKDVPSRPVYGVGEESKLRISRVLFTMSWLLYKRFWWRMGMLYVVRDFHPLVLFYVLGTGLLGFGLLAGIAISAYALWVGDPSGATAVLVSLAVQLGLMLTLFGMLFDFEHNRPLNPGERGRPARLDRRGEHHESREVRIETSEGEFDDSSAAESATELVR